MDSMSFPADIFGSAPSSFSATKRLGSDAFRLSQLQDARWKVVSDYFEPPKE
jgi:branched-chain amino acid transport system substrate-binding protein